VDRRFGNGPLQLGTHDGWVVGSRQVFVFWRSRLSLLRFGWRGSRVLAEKVCDFVSRLDMNIPRSEGNSEIAGLFRKRLVF
jgi:hypothetical protein